MFLLISCLQTEKYWHLFRIISDGHAKLYEHSTACPVALKMFLRCQPNYWCFVPMTREQAMADDANITSSDRNILDNYQIHDSIGVGEASSKHIRDSILVRWCVNNLPQPPPTYQFSMRQRIEQYEFFRDRLDLFPTRFFDLYNTAIVIARKASLEKLFLFIASILF